MEKNEIPVLEASHYESRIRVASGTQDHLSNPSERVLLMLLVGEPMSAPSGFLQSLRFAPVENPPEEMPRRGEAKDAGAGSKAKEKC